MTIEEEMNAMINGEFTSKVMSDEEKAQLEAEENEGSPETGDEIAEPQENTEQLVEDTEAPTEDESEGETKDEEVAPSPETQEDESEEKPEDSQPDEVNEDKEEKKEDEPEKESESEVDKQKYEQILKEYEDLKAFRDKVTSDFKANGRTVKGFEDPEKIVKNLQMASGLTEKLNGYKKVKPVIKFLENEELLDRPEDLKLAAKIVKGDKEALKYLIKENNIDVTDYMDIDEVNYQKDGNIVSREEMLFEDIRDVADDYGVGERFTHTILRDWDTDSAAILLDGNQGKVMSARLAEQMSNGVYDEVNAIAENLKMSDYAFRSLNSLQQYEEASKIYNAEIAKKQEMEIATQEKAEAEANRLAEEEAARVQRIADEKARIEKERLDREYAEKAKLEKEKADAAREAAVRASQPKPTVTAEPTKPKSTNDFRDEWKKLMSL